ncbi:hypothetical protein C8R47DRAFT_1063550 [Mycena vitilis]|nr:hypothetical protein C8R47DRAFT_1063550 [Mycena vitilis]
MHSNPFTLTLFVVALTASVFASPAAAREGLTARGLSAAKCEACITEKTVRGLQRHGAHPAGLPTLRGWRHTRRVPTIAWLGTPHASLPSSAHSRATQGASEMKWGKEGEIHKTTAI